MAKAAKPKRRVYKPGEPTGAAIKFRPTEEQRDSVKQLRACGWQADQIAVALRIPARTLYRHFANELKGGEFEIKSKVARNIAFGAVNGDKTLMIFYAKAQMGWRDSYRVGFEDKDGQPANMANLFTINITGMEPGK